MKVKELIKKLKEFPPGLEVTISDGYDFRFYVGNFSVELFEDEEGTSKVDIGIGGFEQSN
jgi:hypothetical protein